MYHIECRRWFQRTFGNTYHSVRIFKGNQLIAHLPFAYGYGEQCLQTALDWLRANNHIDGLDEQDRPIYGTRYIREDLHSTYSIIDVERKKDL